MAKTYEIDGDIIKEIETKEEIQERSWNKQDLIAQIAALQALLDRFK